MSFFTFPALVTSFVVLRFIKCTLLQKLQKVAQFGKKGVNSVKLCVRVCGGVSVLVKCRVFPAITFSRLL